MALTLASLLPATGCADDGELRTGQNVAGLRYEPFDPDEGVHPSDVTLLNPRNPFRSVPLRVTTAFEIFADTGGAAGFYAFATLLARQPQGQFQLITSVALEDVYRSGAPSDDDLCGVRNQAIRGYQSILDNFAGDFVFAPSGDPLFRVVPPAYFAIDELGENPLGDWVVIQQADGTENVVSGAGSDLPREEPPERINTGLDPFVPGERRLSLAAYYEGPFSCRITINARTRNEFIFPEEFTGVPTYTAGQSSDAIEGTVSTQITHNGTNFWGGGVFYDAGLDFDFGTWTTMRVGFKSADDVFDDIDVSMFYFDAAGDEVGVTLSASDYGYVNDGVWHVVEIPLDDFAAAGVDLGRIRSPFTIGGPAGSNGETLLVDGLYFTAD